VTFPGWWNGEEGCLHHATCGSNHRLVGFKRLSKKKEKQSLLAKNKWIFKKKQKKAA
jgi:hypothetical protein